MKAKQGDHCLERWGRGVWVFSKHPGRNPSWIQAYGKEGAVVGRIKLIFLSRKVNHGMVANRA